MNNNQSCCHHKYLSWRAAFAGAIVAVGLTFLFNVLTLGLGLSLFTPDPAGKMVLAFSGVAWMLVGSYVVLYIPGWVAGRLVSDQYSFHLANGMLHGFITWTIYLIICTLLLSVLTDSISGSVLKSFYVDIVVSKPSANSSDVVATVHANKLGYAGLMSFFIFLIGALGCCIGASCGIKDSKRCYLKDKSQLGQNL